MSDLLSRRFRDKLQSRTHPLPRQAARAEAVEEAVPPDSLRVVHLEHGTIADAAAINRRFAVDQPLLRLTLALGSDLAARTRPLNADERGRLLALCPYLPLHGCEAEGGILDLLSPLAGSQISSAGGDIGGDGLSTAHLIEHVALDLAATAAGGLPLSGATCAHRDVPGRFDILLHCEDAGLGHAVALLATAAVRDLSASTDRTVTHTRCASLLTDLAVSGRRHVVPEDIADRRGWSLDEARVALEDLVRLDFLEPIRAPLTFSTTTGVLFRRTSL
jgi:hypothetical protein